VDVVIKEGDGANKDHLIGRCGVGVSGLRVNEEVDHLFNLNIPQSNNNVPSSPGSSVSSSGFTTTPTLRLKISLTAPYRPLVKTAQTYLQLYFVTVDRFADGLSPVLSRVKSAATNRYAVIAGVPAAVVAVSCLPMVAGIFVLGLPVFLPLLAFALFGATLAFTAAVTLAASTRDGRRKASRVLEPARRHVYDTAIGQRILYDVGPAPNPVTLANFVLPKDMWHKLIVSLAIDFVGSCSYLIPGAGEVTDLAWAPIQTSMIMAMYDEEMPYLKYVSFAEEILPFTDILPTASLGWCRMFLPTLIVGGGERLGEVVRRYQRR